MKPSLLCAHLYFSHIIIGVHRAVLWGCPPRELAFLCHHKLCLGAGLCRCYLRLVLCLWMHTVTLFVCTIPSCLDTVREPPTVFARVDLHPRWRECSVLSPHKRACCRNIATDTLLASRSFKVVPCSENVPKALRQSVETKNQKAVCFHPSAVQTLR